MKGKKVLPLLKNIIANFEHSSKTYLEKIVFPFLFCFFFFPAAEECPCKTILRRAVFHLGTKEAQFCPTQLSKVLSCASFEEESSHLKFGRPRLQLGKAKPRSIHSEVREEGEKLTVLCLSQLMDKRLQGRSRQEKQRWVPDETLPLEVKELNADFRGSVSFFTGNEHQPYRRVSTTPGNRSPHMT